MAFPHLPAFTGARLRQLRGELSLRELARRIGCSASHLCEVENGLTIASDEFIEKVEQTLGIQMLRGLDRPRKEGRPMLPGIAGELRKAFGATNPTRPVQPLRQAFALARYNAKGRELVDQLDGVKRPGTFWRGVKWLAGEMNGPEQGVLLRLLLPEPELHEVHPRVVGIPLPVVEPPGHRWLAPVNRHDGLLIAFPQLQVVTRRDRPPRRMDFLLGLVGVGLSNLEVDGPTHRGRMQADRVRAEEIGLPTLRVSATRMWQDDFLAWLVAELRRTTAG